MSLLLTSIVQCSSTTIKQGCYPRLQPHVLFRDSFAKLPVVVASDWKVSLMLSSIGMAHLWQMVMRVNVFLGSECSVSCDGDCDLAILYKCGGWQEMSLRLLCPTMGVVPAEFLQGPCMH